VSEITLKIQGKVYSGWESIEVIKSLDNITTTFGFLVSNRYPGHLDKWDVKLGQTCSVYVGDVRVAKGFIDEVNPTYSGESHAINISGRDVTGDLVDCCHWYEGSVDQWDNQTVQAIVEALCDPFDIDVVVDSSAQTAAAKLISSFKNNQGDKVFELISKVCRSRAILPVSYGDGKLTLTRRGTDYTTDSLELGKNILGGSANFSNLERYSDYIVKGSSPGDDFLMPTTNTPKGQTSDEIIQRHRPLVLLLEEGECDNEKCGHRANWESTLRAGKSRSYDYKVQGWLQSDGEPWPLNKLVKVKDSLLGITKKGLLISSVTFTLSNDGRTTDLTLVHPSTYDLIEEPIKKIKGASDLSALTIGSGGT
jgi:prophage tail gpP-like protein